MPNDILQPKAAHHIIKQEETLSERVETLLQSEKYMTEHSSKLVEEANKLIQQDSWKKCCNSVEVVLGNIYPNCKTHPFGSRTASLGNKDSDLDVFVDVGSRYIGQSAQDIPSQSKFVKQATNLFKKNSFKIVYSVPFARTPILRVFHISTQINCDLSFGNGLAVENAKFFRLCIELQPMMQPLILLLKQWLEYCGLDGDIKTFIITMMVIFYFQTLKYLMPVHDLKQMNPKSIKIINVCVHNSTPTLKIEQIPSTNRLIPAEFSSAILRQVAQLLIQLMRGTPAEGQTNKYQITNGMCAILGHFLWFRSRSVEFNKLLCNVLGWPIPDMSVAKRAATVLRGRIVPYSGSIKHLLMGFFKYYSNFSYSTDVICPLLGRTINKALFFEKPNRPDLPLEMFPYVERLSTVDTEYFKAGYPFCVQDPFDLSSNVTKRCTDAVVKKLKTFCDLSFKYLSSYN